MLSNAHNDVTSRLPVGVAILLSKRGKVALSQRLDPTRDFYKLWQFPGGTQEPGEANIATAVRELYEETGLCIDPARFQLLGMGTRTFTNGQPYLGVCYHVPLRDNEEPMLIEAHKSTAWEWFDPHIATSMQLIPGSSAFIPMACKMTRLPEYAFAIRQVVQGMYVP